MCGNAAHRPDHSAQITILDAGGQYCHLIARKVRELGVYADVRRSDTPRANSHSRGSDHLRRTGQRLRFRSPKVDPAILRDGHPVLGICYGQQLMAYLLGGGVRKATRASTVWPR